MSGKEEWVLVIAMDDGEAWTNPRAIRGVLGPWSKAEAEEKLAEFKRRHPEKSAGIQRDTLEPQEAS